MEAGLVPNPFHIQEFHLEEESINEEAEIVVNASLRRSCLYRIGFTCDRHLCFLVGACGPRRPPPHLGNDNNLWLEICYGFQEKGTKWVRYGAGELSIL